MTEPRTPRTRRGAEAVDAAIEAYELTQRTDEPDPSVRGDGDLDLGWVRERIDAARKAADADVVSSEEALAWLAETVNREVELDLDEDAESPEAG